MIAKAEDPLMEPIRLPIAEFLKRPNIWRIPVYQRHYSWEIKEHGPVTQFWESVQEQVNDRLNNQPRSVHYLGALLLDHQGEEKSGRHKYDVVDGQQRVTTIQLALCALVCVAKDEEVETEVKDIFEYISYENNGAPIPTLNPSNFDKKQFNEVFVEASKRMINLGGDYSRNKENWEKSNVYETFKFFCTKINELLKDDSDANDKKIKALKEVLLNGFDVVLILLKRSDEAQKIFESMNNTAEPLTTFDLIRNDVFYRTSKNGDNDEDLFYSDEWQEFEKPFWERKSSQRKTGAPHVDDYIARMLIAKQREPVKFERSDLFRKYKEFGQECFPGNTNAEVKSISEYIDIYKYLVREHDNAPGNVRCSFFREWKDKAFYSLLFVVLSSNADAHEKKRMIKLLENYIVRRSVCGLTNKGYNKIALEILKEHSQVNYSGLHKFLSSQKTDTSIFPTDEKMRQDGRHAKFYTDRHNIQNYILEQIELCLRTNQDEEIKFSGLTLDHIMPQTRDEKDNWTTADEESFVDDYIHTIGNITLLPGPKNTSKKNYPFEKVKEKFLESSLIINREIAKQVCWNLDSIKIRSDELAISICKRWPYDVSA